MKKSISKTFGSILLKAAIILIPAATAFAANFSDVPTSHTYQKGIQYLAQEDIVHGHPDGTFRPGTTLNRAEMMKIVAEGAAKYHGRDQSVFENHKNENCFNDVPGGEWFTPYICYGKDQGWVQGYADGNFRPGQNVNFVEALKITFMGFGIPYNEDGTPWYRNAVEYASAKNYIPFTITAFGADLKRGEMADMITRVIKADQGIAQLNTYLGNRANIVATYDTILNGVDLSKMTPDILK